MATPAQIKAQIKYAKTHLKRIPLDVSKEYYNDILKPAADMMDEPVNTFIKKAIEERLDRIYGKLTEEQRGEE